jgi:transcriptional regulator with XRE-family HTH domain
MTKNITIMETPNFDRAVTAELLGEAVRARRTQSHLRLEDAAALCGVAKDTLMKIEHGSPSCQLISLLKVCDGLGIKLCILPWSSDGEVNDEWQ